MDRDTYQLSHSAQGCACSDFHINGDHVQKILRETNTFPILRFDQLNEDAGLVVEEYKEETEYVALSQVRPPSTMPRKAANLSYM